MEKKSYKNTNTNNSQPNKIRGGETNIMKNNMKKTLAVLSTTAMLAGVAAPAAVLMTPAQAVQAASPIEATGVPTLADGVTNEDGTLANQGAGAIKFTVPAGSLRANDTVIFNLPDDVDFDGVVTDAVYEAGTHGNYFFVPKLVGETANGIDYNQLEVVYDSENSDQVQLKINSENGAFNGQQGQKLDKEAVIYFRLEALKIDDGVSGPLNVTLETPPTSGFPYGEVTVANVGTGSVLLSTEGTKTSNNSFAFDLKIKETLAAALEEGDSTLKLELPDGFKWDKPTDKKYDADYGIDSNFTFEVNDEELEINLTNETTSASLWKLPLSFYVEDDSKVENGAIMATIKGETDVNVDELKVGTYGEYGTEVYADEDIPTILSGKKEQQIADIHVDENLAESLVEDRTVEFKLPEGAQWTKVDDDSDSSAGLGSAIIKNDGRTLKLTVDQAAGGKAELVLEKMEVALEAGFKGDLEVEVGGSAGVVGNIKVAEVVNPVTVESTNTPVVTLGINGQKAGNIIIKEAVEAALAEGDSSTLTIELPSGVEFAKLPTVEVTEGDLKISNVKVTDDYKLTFDIDNESDVASTIEVSDIELKLYRDVPEGEVKVEVKGSSAIETNDDFDAEDSTGDITLDGWNNSDVVADVTIATVGTPAPRESSANASFVIGNATYSANGVEKAMDVAPFIKDGRTFLPVRYVADAVGVSEDNIIWNQAAKTVTIMKGDRVAQLTIGSNILTVNGVQIPMDVKADVVDGRTVLPLRYVAQALGAQVDYDEVTKTVSVK